MLGPLCHWVYSSQYMMTYFLTSGVVERAHLLLERYRTLVDDEYEGTTSHDIFVNKHTAIEKDMNYERARNKRIKRIFSVTDIAVSVLMLIG